MRFGHNAHIAGRLAGANAMHIVNQLGAYSQPTHCPAGRQTLIQSGGNPSKVTVHTAGEYYLIVGLWGTLCVDLTKPPTQITLHIDAGMGSNGGFECGPRSPGLIMGAGYGPFPPWPVGRLYLQGPLPNSPSNIVGANGVQGLEIKAGDTLNPAIYLEADADVIVETGIVMTWYLLPTK